MNWNEKYLTYFLPNAYRRALEGSKVLKCELQKGLKSGMITTIGKKIVRIMKL